MIAFAWTTAALVAAPAVPLLLVGLWLLRRTRPWAVALIPWAAIPALALALASLLGAPRPTAELPVVATGLRLALDGVGAVFLLLTALLWVTAGAFARSYHADDARRDRFFGFFALTMAGNLGLVAAGEVLTFYLFFALMTFSAYGLVVHRRDGEARRAGRVYIVLAFVGEVAILTGVFVLVTVAGGPVPLGAPLEEVWTRLAMDPVVPASPWETEPGVRPLPGMLASVPVAAAFLLGGLAVKVGLVPVHMWLPLAHPIAPTAASALLSGAMVKAGVLGWIRLVPPDPEAGAVGVTMVVLGLLTAFYGVIAGLAQDDPKTVLAYSTVSQMGYVGVGMGVVLAAPDLAPLATAAILIHVLHHGVAKGALFLSVGVVDHLPGRLRARRTWRAGLLALLVLPAVGLAGAPFTSGAQAKGALKAVLGGWTDVRAEGITLDDRWYVAVDWLLLVAAAGTALLLARFLVTLSGRAAGEGDEGGRVPWGLVGPWLALVGVGTAAPLWYPLLLPAPVAGALPPVLEDLAAAAGPLVVAGVVVWLSLRHALVPVSVRRIRLPEGDVVVLLESAISAASRPGWGEVVLRLRATRGRVLEALVRGGRVVEGLSGRDPVLMRGVLFGSLVLVLVSGLALVLSG